ncbi:hypothetical protein KC953_00920 [Candidatus Saccharibacteria bacterium]|nr:hypothetical protein [Candidatus Saccharibacteria bacterium]
MKLSRIIISTALVFGVIVSSGASVLGISLGGGSVQGYSADKPLDTGTIVQLDSSRKSGVKVTSKSQLQNMFGVTVDRNILPVTISSESLKNEVFVAVSGTYNVLVSTQAGEIAVGDFVTLSSIDGVAMKAGTKEKTVFGRAVGAFDGKKSVLGTSTLKDATSNKTQNVVLGSIPVTIDIKRNPNIQSTKADLPSFLQRIGQQIAEKEVSPIRIYLSMAISAISIIAALAMLYAGVRNSVISIGRNPMSKKSIFRALIEVILTSLLILIIGLFAVYLLLRL